MIDVKFLRENPDKVRKAISLKKFDCDLDAILAFDEVRRGIVSRAEEAKAKQNQASKEMARMPKGSDEFKSKVAELKTVSAEVKALEAEAA